MKRTSFFYVFLPAPVLQRLSLSLSRYHSLSLALAHYLSFSRSLLLSFSLSPSLFQSRSLSSWLHLLTPLLDAAGGEGVANVITWPASSGGRFAIAPL